MVAISVIIPAKNESATIGKVVEGLFSLDLDLEVIVVDDGSQDGTGELAKEKGARVILNLYSKGNGAAIKSGTRQAKGEILVFMDADGQHDPLDLPILLEELENGNDMVVGARNWASQANIGRGFANSVYNWLASYMTGHNVRDLTSGFRVTRAEIFRKFLHLLPNGFSYPTTSTMAFFRDGYTVSYKSISVNKRVGRSHINVFKDGIRFFLVIFKIGTLYSPLKIFAPIAASFIFLGLLRYIQTYLADGQFTNMSALFMSVGIVIFLVGLVSEQITSLIYQIVDKRENE